MFEKCEQLTSNPDSFVSSSSNISQKVGRSSSISNGYNDFYNSSTSRFNNSSISSATFTNNNQRSLNDRNLYSYQRNENKVIDFDQELKTFLKDNEHSLDVNKTNEQKNESLNQLDEIVSICLGYN
jgi:hypothetical protein